jgi:CubicO group peptidase (beta-lactamase class C family)
MLLHASAFARDDVSADLKCFTKDGKVPGMAVAAVLDGRIVAAGASGVRITGDPAKATIFDKFHIGSCTKSMTGSLAAMLVADRKITWKTTVAEVFPELDIHPGYRKATLLQMASNSGGVPGEFAENIWNDTVARRTQPEADQRDALVRALLKNPPAYPPGTRNVYSNGGFTIAGAMLERASGKSYAELARIRLFKPLGMTSAGFGPPASPGKVDHPYGHLKRLGRIVPVPPGPDADNPPAITPAGRCHLSILDFAKYASFHAGTARNAPLGPKALDFLHKPVAPSKDYALGWLSLSRPWAHGKALAHNGSNTMFYAVIWVAPARDFAAVAAANIDNPAAQKACDEACAMMISRYLEKPAPLPGPFFLHRQSRPRPVPAGRIDL